MRRQRGFALLELTVAMLLATLLAVWGAHALANRINDAAAQSAAAWMLSIKSATQSYLQRYAPVFLAATGTAALADKGFANWTTPSLAQLKADGLLSAGFPEQGVRGLTATIQLMRTGICPGSQCRLDALIYGNQALLGKGWAEADGQMTAQWLMAAQGWGGTVTQSHPDRIGGASFAFANPPQGNTALLPVGTVALAITWEQLSSLDYLRVKDYRDPDFQGTATVKGDINAGASVAVQKYLSIGAQEYAYTYCATDGLIAREYNGGLLLCRNSQWLSAGGSGGGGFSTNSETSCPASNRNPVTGGCDCPAGYLMVRISDSGPHPAPDGRTRGYLCVG